MEGHPGKQNIKYKRKKIFSWKSISPYFYLAPAVILVGVLFVYSAIFTFFVSFMDWDGLNVPEFIGLENYIDIFTDEIFLISIVNTIVWVIACLLLPVGLGLLLALAIQRMWAGVLYKNIFYLPHAISLTSADVIWSFLLSNQGISTFFEDIGWDWLVRDWLRETPLNTISMIASFTWQNIGTNMVLFLVGLQTIPKDKLEAGMLDGASGWTLFRHITFPLLKPITNVVVLMAVVNSAKVFDSIWVMTQGGPYRSSETLVITMYREAFVLSDYGKGAAVAVVLSIFVLIFSWGYLRSSLKEQRF